MITFPCVSHCPCLCICSLLFLFCCASSSVTEVVRVCCVPLAAQRESIARSLSCCEQPGAQRPLQKLEIHCREAEEIEISCLFSASLILALPALTQSASLSKIYIGLNNQKTEVCCQRLLILCVHSFSTIRPTICSFHSMCTHLFKEDGLSISLKVHSLHFNSEEKIEEVSDTFLQQTY